MNNKHNAPTTPSTTTPWYRYRDQRMAHTRELRQLAIHSQGAPRCGRCEIVLEFRPAGEPCRIAQCPLSRPADRDTLRMP